MAICIIYFKVSKESIQIEGVITNFPVNYYADEIEFDTDGIAMITCERASEATIDVICWPYQVRLNLQRHCEMYIRSYIAS